MAPTIDLICAYAPCAKSFPVLPHQAHIWKYCSTTCYHLARTTQTHEAFAARFWRKVARATREECWLWTAALHGQSGYGNFRATPYKNGNVSAHVVSWFLHTGTWVPQGVYVLHTCDTPACVNPTHLWLGTQIDNMQDAARKGRQGYLTRPERVARGIRHGRFTKPERTARGDRNGMRLHPESVLRGDKSPQMKVTESQVEEAVKLYATGKWTLAQLGQRHGITPQGMRYRIKQHKPS